MAAEGLASYKSAMDDSFVMRDLQTFHALPKIMENRDSMFADYSKMTGEVFDAIFVVDGTPQRPLEKRIMPIIKRRGMFKLLGEVRGAPMDLNCF